MQIDTTAPRDTVIYDGNCHFCIKQVERIKELDTGNSLDYCPRQSEDLHGRFPELKDMNFEEGMRFVSKKRQIYVGADAVYQIATKLPGIALIAWIYLLPGINQVAKLIYSWIAANRQRLGQNCQNNACSTGSQAVPSETVK